MNPLMLAVVLQLAAVIIIIAEVIIPSGGLLSILAASLIGYSLYTVFHGVSAQAGYLMVGIDVVALPLVILLGLKLLARSPAALRAELSSTAGVTSQRPDLEGFAGKKGTAITDLRPSGVALIDGKRVDVVSRGAYIDKNSALVVCAVTGNQVIVTTPE
ncbi:MAG: NfeD family protein [Thermodesulfobacteriota bacterium]